jgi:catechol 2,3-dioxygenase-like lactoylglutathione lyase family enzyme/predicted enzyme related to lactoylglutathione lyase
MGTMNMPGAKFVLELTQFSGVERNAGQPLHTDPGAANLQLRVRDIDSVFAAIKKSGAPIITASGMPVKIGSASGNIRSMLVRDPDGFVLEVIQILPTADAPAVYGVGIGLTAANLDATRKFYHDMLGFDLTAPTALSGDKAILDMVGAPSGAEYRQMAGDVPGTNAHVEFYEYKGLPRTPFHLRVPNPGAPTLVLRVNDLDGILKRLRAINTQIVSAHGEPVQFSPTIRKIFVVDPNGVNLELYESKP